MNFDCFPLNSLARLLTQSLTASLVRISRHPYKGFCWYKLDPVQERNTSGMAGSTTFGVAGRNVSSVALTYVPCHSTWGLPDTRPSNLEKSEHIQLVANLMSGGYLCTDSVEAVPDVPPLQVARTCTCMALQ